MEVGISGPWICSSFCIMSQFVKELCYWANKNLLLNLNFKWVSINFDACRCRLLNSSILLRGCFLMLLAVITSSPENGKCRSEFPNFHYSNFLWNWSFPFPAPLNQNCLLRSERPFPSLVWISTDMIVWLKKIKYKVCSPLSNWKFEFIYVTEMRAA